MGSGFRDYNQVNNLLNPDPAAIALDVAANLAIAGATKLVAAGASEMFDSFFSQSPSLRGSQPSQESGNKRETQDGWEGQSDGTCKRARVTNTQTLGVNDFVNTPSDVIGAHNALSIGNNVEKAIMVKLNAAQTTPKLAYEYLLKHMLGTGRVELTWAGSMNSDLNKRHRHYECFRHNLFAVNAQETCAAYPANMEPYILKPTMEFNSPNAGNNMTDVGWINFNWPSTSIQGDGKAFFPALNRADYEDMMWNLNRLKLTTVIGQEGGPQFTDTAFASDVPQMNQACHRGVSEIYLNNIVKAYTNPVPNGSLNLFTGARYNYNAVFKNGHVTYNFMNKGAGPAKVEIVVLKVRKQGSSVLPSPQFIDPSGTSLSDVVSQFYEKPVSTGYINTVYNKFGTDDLSGRRPLVDDVLSNARYPFLPELKRTVKAESGFKEVQRISFIATAGSRRTVKIQLGGKIYDPASTAQNLNYNDAYQPDKAPNLLDEHSYVIGISCCGCRASRIIPAEVTYDPASDPPNQPILKGAGIIGDVHSESLVQYYASYVEEIGAMSYKDPGYGKIFVGGAMVQPDDRGYLPRSQAGIVLPQDHAVRIPGAFTRTAETGGSSSISAEEPHINLTSSNNRNAP